MKRFTCAGCGHEIDESEVDDLAEAAREHGREAHDKEVPIAKIRSEMIEEVEEAGE